MHADIGDGAARRDELLAQFEGDRDAHRLDGGIDAALAGQLHDRLQGLAVGAVDGRRGAEALGHLKPIVVEIDHDDLGRRVELGGEEGCEPDRARADDRHGAARRNLAVEHAALEAGRQDVAEHDQRFFVGAVGNGIEAGVRVGMRTNSAWVPSIVLPRIQPPVVQCEYICLRQYSHLPQALTQEIRTRSPALNAVTADSNLVDDADALVSENAAGLARRDVALEDVQVGAADRRFGDLDDRVGGRRDARLGTVFEGFLARPLIDERFHHRAGC